mgnify:CR=1 FL=1
MREGAVASGLQVHGVFFPGLPRHSAASARQNGPGCFAFVCACAHKFRESKSKYACLRVVPAIQCCLTKKKKAGCCRRHHGVNNSPLATFFAAARARTYGYHSVLPVCVCVCLCVANTTKRKRACTNRCEFVPHIYAANEAFV